MHKDVVARVIGQTGGGTRIYIYQLNQAIEKTGSKTITYLRKPELPDAYVSGSPGGMDYRHSFSILRMFRELIPIRSRISYIHSHLRNATALGFALSIFLKIPHVITVHGPLHEGPATWKDRVLSWVFNKASRHAAITIYISHYVRSLVQSQARINPTKALSAVVHNGTNAPNYPPQKVFSKLILCFAGELTERKNVADLIWLCERISSSGHGPLLEIHVYGVGKLNDDMARAQALYSFLTWHGFEPDMEKIFLGKTAHLILSTTEGFGRVVTEAMALGVPTLAYRAGAFPELITNEVDGLLFDDREALAASIMELALDPERLRGLSEAGLMTFSSRFSEERFVAETLRAIDAGLTNGIT